MVLSDVAATVPAMGKDRIELTQDMTAEHSMWIAVRALGNRQEPRNMVVAHSAPIYVVVDGEPTWKPPRCPSSWPTSARSCKT